MIIKKIYIWNTKYFNKNKNTSKILSIHRAVYIDILRQLYLKSHYNLYSFIHNHYKHFPTHKNTYLAIQKLSFKKCPLSYPGESKIYFEV